MGDRVSDDFVVIATTSDGEFVHAAADLAGALCTFTDKLRGGRYALGSGNQLRVVSEQQWLGSQAIRARQEAAR